MDRYQRQIKLKQIGIEGQNKLLRAKILVVGAGGLGCPVLTYLTAAGIGHLGIVDHDEVNLTDLHRQVLYTNEDIGFSKAERASVHLRKMNPDVKTTPYSLFLTPENAMEIIELYDTVVDATDNFPTRYMLNDACVLAGKPLIYGAVSDFEGQVSVLNLNLANGELSANFRDIFPQPPAENEIKNCAEGGILGVLPGIIGCHQANEIIKIVTGAGKPLYNQLYTINLLTNDSQIFSIKPLLQTRSLIPPDIPSFKQKNYSLLCSPKLEIEIEAYEFYKYFDRKDVIIVDVREPFEQPVIDTFGHFKYPLSLWEQEIPDFTEQTIIVFCQAGIRSLEAAKKLLAIKDGKNIYSLKNGILHWQKLNKTNR